MKVLAENAKDVDAHMVIFNLDLKNPSPLALSCANLLKHAAYVLVKENLKVDQISDDESA